MAIVRRSRTQNKKSKRKVVVTQGGPVVLNIMTARLGGRLTEQEIMRRTRELTTRNRAFKAAFNRLEGLVKAAMNKNVFV